MDTQRNAADIEGSGISSRLSPTAIRRAIAMGCCLPTTGTSGRSGNCLRGTRSPRVTDPGRNRDLSHRQERCGNQSVGQESAPTPLTNFCIGNRGSDLPIRIRNGQVPNPGMRSSRSGIDGAIPERGRETECLGPTREDLGVGIAGEVEWRHCATGGLRRYRDRKREYRGSAPVNLLGLLRRSCANESRNGDRHLIARGDLGDHERFRLYCLCTARKSDLNCGAQHKNRCCCCRTSNRWVHLSALLAPNHRRGGRRGGCYDAFP